MSTREKKVLVVDDDPWMLKIFDQYLGQLGLAAITTENPYKAVAMAIKFKPDIIFLDMIMPALNGKDILILLKEIEITQSIPVIMCSAYLDLDKADNAIMEYASGHLNKPVSQQALFSCISEYI